MNRLEVEKRREKQYQKSKQIVSDLPIIG
ncbi:hypothetical protein BL05327 [Bacillus licheniformis DSM 13 = ATCC 14580]|uniref:Uncharacterized protein n=1 Tax=Bacillus licheniformis (strain ATCC 14580 / DSM 13 / JCM 2505 / CCUG 7422 / NBRC 12200 / NCIMB 9375 / NCTC 10341 / NRRL NRS-1264 / Gibson 46) TaxID=279010 RepID=Q62QP9_BACLD|nr:hypothetical protein BL05327 [Bacillus licheniformis DSM 13 = ATCC 14580]